MLAQNVKLEMQKCGQILCTRKTHFLMLGHNCLSSYLQHKRLFTRIMKKLQIQKVNRD